MELYSATHMILTVGATFAITALVCWAMVSLSTWACDTSFKRRGARLRKELDAIFADDDPGE